MARCVEAEVLDALAADDPRGQRSRRDLQRVHVAMRSVRILQRAVASLGLARAPLRILELGSGDGTLMLKFARAQRPPWKGVEITLLDRIDLVSPETLDAYREIGWEAKTLCADAVEWAAAPRTDRYDLCFANLFLHHFEGAHLTALLRAAAAAADAFVACEPRRSGLARLGSRLIGFLGANEVTRGDAVKSVAAGFADRDLSAAWGAAGNWLLEEFSAPPFSHCFVAVRAKEGIHGL